MGTMKDSKEILESAQALYDCEWTQDEAVTFIALVYTCEWKLRDRIQLAWRIVSKR